MDDSAVLPHPTRPDLLSAALGVYLPAVPRPAGWFSQAGTDTFQARLERKHELTAESARRLEVEYRRYLYLKAAHGGVLTPSKRVDQAWHLHMETLGLDWERSCQAWFGTRIEHLTGLSPQDTKVGYERTRDLYRKEFGEDPPKDIWPGEAEQARARLANWVGALGLGSFFLGMGIGIVSSVLTDAPEVKPLDTTAGVVSAWLCYGGFGTIFLAGFLSKGTDLDKVASCG